MVGTLNEFQAMESGPCSSGNVTSTGTIYSGAARIRGIIAQSSSASGSVVLKDGGSSGTVKFTFPLGADNTVGQYTVPGAGIVCGTDIHATLSSCDSCTVLYST